MLVVISTNDGQYLVFDTSTVNDVIQFTGYNLHKNELKTFPMTDAVRIEPITHNDIMNAVINNGKEAVDTFERITLTQMRVTNVH